MPDPEMIVVSTGDVRLRGLIQALLTALADERDESLPSDYALMRALLFRIGLELGGDGEDSALRASATRAHLHDVEQALTALEVLGDSCRADFRTQALMFVEWQLVHLDRTAAHGRVANAAGPHPDAAFARLPALPGTVSRSDAPPVTLSACAVDLRYRRLLQDSLSRARTRPHPGVVHEQATRLAG